MTTSKTMVVLAALAVPFSIFLTYNEDPWALGRFAVVGMAYLAAIILSISWFADTRDKRKSVLILLVSLVVVLGGVYALSGGNGYPATNVTNSTSYSCTTFTTQTNSSGYPAQGSGFSCTGYTVPTGQIPFALGYNLLAWVPLVGCVLFSLPAWGDGAVSKYDSLARLFGGSVPASAILLNLVGIQTPGTLLTLPVLHVPLNPYLAYGLCDSTTSTGGCAYVNHLYVLIDYAFWFGVVVLTSAAVGVVISHRKPSGTMVRKAAISSLALAFLLITGLAVVPASVASSGVLVPPGGSFTFHPNSSFVRIPFVGSQSKALSGSFESSAPVDVYVMNSSQFLPFDQDGGDCPASSVTPLLANATQGSLAIDIGTGSYSLIFCASFQPNSNIRVAITNAIRLSS